MFARTKTVLDEKKKKLEKSPEGRVFFGGFRFMTVCSSVISSHARQTSEAFSNIYYSAKEKLSMEGTDSRKECVCVCVCVCVCARECVWGG